MRFGRKVGDYAVSEDGAGDGEEVFAADHVAAMEGGAGFGSENEVLDGARARSPADELVDPLGSFFGVGSGTAHEGDGIVVDVIRDGHSAD